MGKLTVTILIGALLAVAGQPEPLYAYNCEPAQLTAHSFNGQQNTYAVTRFCTSIYGDNVEILEITYAGTWNGGNEVASEQVTAHFRYYHDGEQHNDQTNQYQVTAKCLQDPWVTGMACYSHHVENPNPNWGGLVHSPPNPKGAAILPVAVRQSLQQEHAALREAPTILAPAQAAAFGFPASIPVRIEHNPNQNLRFQIEWRPDAQHALQQVSSTLLSGIQTSDGITTATLTPDKEGEWTIRAQLDTTASPWWSDPVTVKVQTPAAEATDAIPLPAFGPLTKPEFEQPRYNHTYNANDLIPLQIRFQQNTRLHVRLGLRAKGTTEYTMLEEEFVPSNNSGFLNSKLPGWLGALVDGDAAELLIKAWVERRAEGDELNMIYLSEVAELTTTIVAPELVITAPQEAAKITAPAQVHFVVRFGLSENLQEGLAATLFDVQLQRAEKIPGSAIAFTTSPEPVVLRKFGDLLMFSYDLAAPALYRFRLRFTMNPQTPLYGKWSDWRRVELTPSLSQLKPVALADKPTLQATGPSLSVKPTGTTGPGTGLRPTPDAIAKQALTAIPGNNPAPQQLAPQGSSLPQLKPIIVRPVQGQKLPSGPSVSLMVQGLDKDGDTDWEIEYHPFGEKRYTRMPPASLNMSGGRTTLQASGYLTTTGDGEYRIRFRSSGGRQPWGQWREFQVGSPAVKQLVRPATTTKPVLAAPALTTQSKDQAASGDKTQSTATQPRQTTLKQGTLQPLKTIKTQ